MEINCSIFSKEISEIEKADFLTFIILLLGDASLGNG
jgi:hypothetical protein